MFLLGRFVEDELIDVRFNVILYVIFIMIVFDDVFKVDINKILFIFFSMNNWGNGKIWKILLFDI